MVWTDVIGFDDEGKLEYQIESDKLSRHTNIMTNVGEKEGKRRTTNDKLLTVLTTN